ncbi:SGNH/GDSL hydrolase family protein [Candidatus Gottesmanbacteria bacterium]|nr:SGNH/GDSL hydrolase family protein [Candidatus Gottesmanbacteria bacterium]
MNLLPFVATVTLAAESVILPLSVHTVKPVVSFADLMKFVGVAADPGEVLGTGTFSATIVAGEAAVAEVRHTTKPQYTIVFLGDSMIDTLGSDLRLVDDELRRVYPGASFTLLNYGVGGENILSGLERVTRDTTYVGLARPSIISLQPDLVVVESFAYNPFPFETGALEQHWLSLAYIVDAISANLPETKIVIAVTIAPNSTVFGDSAPGVAFDAQDKRERTATIKRYLDNALRFAQSQHLPVADVYHTSLDWHGEGKLLYINPGDHIHYSDAGRQLFARTVVNTIVSHKLLEDTPLEAREQ